MGLERFFVLIQLSIASLSYEYPSVETKPHDAQMINQSTDKNVLKGNSSFLKPGTKGFGITPADSCDMAAT